MWAIDLSSPGLTLHHKLCGLSGLVHIKRLEQWLAHSKGTVSITSIIICSRMEGPGGPGALCGVVGVCERPHEPLSYLHFFVVVVVILNVGAEGVGW